MATSIEAKISSVVVSAAGIALALLGLEGEFTYVVCAPGAFTCIRLYWLDLFAIISGMVAVVAGLILFRKTRSSR